MSRHDRLIRTSRAQFLAQGFLDRAGQSLLGAGLLAAGLIVLDRLISLEKPWLGAGEASWWTDLAFWRMLALVLAAGVVAALVLAIARLPGRMRLVGLLDDRLGARARLLTAESALPGETAGPWLDAVTAERDRFLSRAPQESPFPVRVKGRLYWGVAAPVLLALAWSMESRDLLGRRDQETRRFEEKKFVDQVEERVFDGAEDDIEALLEKSDGQGELQEGLKEWLLAKDRFQEAGFDKKQAQSALRDTEQKLREQAETLKSSLAKLDSRMDASQLDRFSQSGQDLQQGKLSDLPASLSRELKDLLDELDQASPEEWDELAQQAAGELSSMADSLEGMERAEKLAQLLRKLADKLSELDADGNGDLSDEELDALWDEYEAREMDLEELAEMLEQLEVLEALANECELGQDMLGELDEEGQEQAGKACEGGNCSGQHGGRCLGKRGLKAKLQALLRKGGQNGGNRPSAGVPNGGRASGWRDSSPTEGDPNHADRRADTQWSGSSILARKSVRGLPEDTIAELPDSDPYKRAAQEEMARVESQRIPYEYREHVKRYHRQMLRIETPEDKGGE